MYICLYGQIRLFMCVYDEIITNSTKHTASPLYWRWISRCIDFLKSTAYKSNNRETSLTCCIYRVFLQVQWLKNGGKCGVCGDSYHGDRPHEAGGKYANGIIAKTYEEGSEMDITVHLTANHLGFFEFRLCPNNNYKARVKQACLDKYLLERADGQGTRFYVPKGKYNAMFNYTLKLPRGLTCSQCVVQWKYRTGKFPGKFAEFRRAILFIYLSICLFVYLFIYLLDWCFMPY